MTNTSLAYLEPVTSPAWTPAAERLLEAMQRGAVLHWTPYGGFVLQLPSGKVTKPRLPAVWTLTRAGLIYTDEPRITLPRTWRAVGRRGIAQ